MASIGRAQAAALADGFIESVGSGDSKDLQPRNIYTEIILLAGELIESATDNLNKSNKNSSGALSASLVATEPVLNANILKVDIKMNFYGLFVNAGVRGTKSGTSTAGYSFKNDFASKNMVKAIQEWIGRAHLSTASVKKYSGYGKHEIKSKSIAELSLSAAYAVAVAVKQKGLKPTGFMDKAIATTSQKVADRIGTALQVDIINAITQ